MPGLPGICAASAVAATSDKGSSERRQKDERCQPRPPAATAHRDANAHAKEQCEGQRRPAGIGSCPGARGRTRAALVAGVVVTMSVSRSGRNAGNGDRAGCIEAQRGQILSARGSGLMAAVIATLPVKPPLGVTVIIAVLPVVAPGATVTAAPLIVKLGTQQP